MKSFDRLLEFHIKPSVQRMAIMDYLINNRTHPAVDEIYNAISPSIPTLSKTTVYNTLKLFAEQGAVQMLTIDERNVCFDVDTSPHPHFLCKKCGKIYDLFAPELNMEVKACEVDGHRISEIHYYYKGTCKNCLD